MEANEIGEDPMTSWQDIQNSIRNCHICQNADDILFGPFNGKWPVLPKPRRKPRRKTILFISEAPPPYHQEQDDTEWSPTPHSLAEEEGGIPTIEAVKT